MNYNDVILVINAGSTSLKFGIYDAKELNLLISGLFESLSDLPHLKINFVDIADKIDITLDSPTTHVEALKHVLNLLETKNVFFKVCSVGHRVVLGGDYSKPVIIDNKSLEYLEGLSIFVPSHQPFNVAGIKAISEIYPNIKQVGVFDSSFHLTMDDLAKTYPLPISMRNLGVKHWGFHGISYDFVSAKVKKLFPDTNKMIVAHLGGGASITAIREGKSVETSMQFSGLTGLPMSTRSGDIPVDVAIYLLKNGYSVETLEKDLYKKSGLYGLSEKYSDMRDIQGSSRPEDVFALDFFVYNITKFIGSYVSVLNGLDTLVFTAGIGENSDIVRAKICSKLEWLEVKIDQVENEKNSLVISSSDSKIRVLVIPTNEEIMIANYTKQITS